jgi:hypothetical protein
MAESSGGDELSFLDRRLPRSFEVRIVDLAPAGVRAYEAAEWRDALVIVEHGEIELEGLHGTRRRFERGAVLWLAGLSVRAIHNSGAGTALLVAVARRRS